MKFVKDPFAFDSPPAPEAAISGAHRKVKEAQRSSNKSSAVSTAVLHGFALDDRALVSVSLRGPSVLVAARSTIPLCQSHIGRTVVLLFEKGDHHLPIIVGVIQDHATPAATPAASERNLSIVADDDRFVVTAEREIVLRCGESSITLTRAGKVIISGKYVVSRSTGPNKIKGAVVDIN